ncbi:MAG: hypothetical protein MUD08_04580 [Cytophagales bacterium]|nr:hypothetical protein [Cytophagales bacterium]
MTQDLLSKFAFIGLLVSVQVFAQPAAKPKPTGKMLVWQFPLNRPHTGVLLGNGTQGLMVWGKDNQLNITIGRAGFWDHRGGNEFSARTTYQEVKRLLEAKDEAGLRKVFEVPKKSEDQPKEPRQIGGGRLEITLPEGWRLVRAELLLATADIRVIAKDKSNLEKTLTIGQSPTAELAWVEVPPDAIGKVSAKLIPSYESPKVQPALQSTGVAAPKTSKKAFDYLNAIVYEDFTQTLPADEPLTIAYLLDKATRGRNRILIGSHLGEGGTLALQTALPKANFPELDKQKKQWWAAYWADVPQITLPDPVLQEITDYGLYKQACTHPPQGVAATLQGPFMEDYQLPPWSNDYHFNINVQMIYTPVLATNRLSHLEPMWAMMKSWLPQLQTNGEKFFGRPGALMLPHAVDDRCRVVGTFWTGTIDHACTAWMAYLAWQHYRYGMGEAILRETAWPLLVGAFEGYWAMLEETDDGQGGRRFSLPVSVSPEFRGDQMTAWGRDASFQLAALHKVAEVLPVAAQLLGKPADPRWADVSRRLPPYATFEGSWIDEWPGLRSKRIALWEGQDLIESHRHHSHLGSIYPFATIDPADPQHKEIVQASINRWVNRGTGMWSGWCVPWASVLHNRMNNTETAVSLLHWWHANFVNEGRGTSHNANKFGISVFGQPIWDKLPPNTPNGEIMQLDAGFGALSAVLELLVQQRRDAIHVLPNLHYQWKNVSFRNIRAEGAFTVSAKAVDGRVAEVRVKSLRGGKLRLAHNLGEKYRVGTQPATGGMFEKDCTPGEEIVLTRAE